MHSLGPLLALILSLRAFALPTDHAHFPIHLDPSPPLRHNPHGSVHLYPDGSGPPSSSPVPLPTTAVSIPYARYLSYAGLLCLAPAFIYLISLGITRMWKSNLKRIERWEQRERSFKIGAVQFGESAGQAGLPRMQQPKRGRRKGMWWVKGDSEEMRTVRGGLEGGVVKGYGGTASAGYGGMGATSMRRSVRVAEV